MSGMAGEMWGLLAETPLHYGAGQSLGVVDLPVAREETTGYPVVFGSGVKGSLREMAEVRSLEMANQLFGLPSSAGWVMATDARLLLLPVRGLERYYWWVTCPALLERWNRDRALVGLAEVSHPIPVVERGQLLNSELEGSVFAEELHFKGVVWPDLAGWVDEVARLIGHEAAARRLAHQLAVVSDEDMCYLAKHALPVTAHNQLEDASKRSANLWYEETVPADTLMYTMLLAPEGGEHDAHTEAFRWLTGVMQERPYLRLGAHETLGHGWFRLRRWEVSNG